MGDCRSIDDKFCQYAVAMRRLAEMAAMFLSQIVKIAFLSFSDNFGRILRIFLGARFFSLSLSLLFSLHDAD